MLIVICVSFYFSSFRGFLTLTLQLVHFITTILISQRLILIPPNFIEIPFRHHFD